MQYLESFLPLINTILKRQTTALNPGRYLKWIIASKPFNTASEGSFDKLQQDKNNGQLLDDKLRQPHCLKPEKTLSQVC